MGGCAKTRVRLSVRVRGLGLRVSSLGFRFKVEDLGLGFL